MTQKNFNYRDVMLKSNEMLWSVFWKRFDENYKYTEVPLY